MKASKRSKAGRGMRNRLQGDLYKDESEGRGSVKNRTPISVKSSLSSLPVEKPKHFDDITVFMLIAFSIMIGFVVGVYI